MTTIVFEVLPDIEGGWNVTRDRVITAGFDQKYRARRHAMSCCRLAVRSGVGAELIVVSSTGVLQHRRRFPVRGAVGSDAGSAAA